MAQKNQQQKKRLTEIMEADTKDGLYPIGSLSLQQSNFSITFSWNNVYKTVKLKNGEDVLKLAEIFSKMLSENGIDNTIEISDQN